MKTIRNNLFTIAFLLFIMGMFLQNMLSMPKTFSELENRFLGQKPSLTLEGLLNSGPDGFARRYEAYFNDQFSGRDGWITLKSISEMLLGKIENNGIVYGKNGYMFEIQRYLDKSRLTKNLEIIKEFCRLYPDSNSFIMLVPSSYTIITDKLPHNPGNIDQLLLTQELYNDAAKDGITGIEIADILLEKSGQYIYYKTDHHWTTLGAFYAANAFLSNASMNYLQQPEITHNIGGFYGTFFRKTKKFNASADTVVLYDTHTTRITVNEQQKDGCYDFNQLNAVDKYAIFLWGNNGLTILENDGLPSRTLLVIKDSFANSMIPFLTKNFSRIIVVDPRHFSGNMSDLMHRETPNDILFVYSLTNITSDNTLSRILY